MRAVPTVILGVDQVADVIVGPFAEHAIDSDRTHRKGVLRMPARGGALAVGALGDDDVAVPVVGGGLAARCSATMR